MMCQYKGCGTGPHLLSHSLACRVILAVFLSERRQRGISSKQVNVRQWQTIAGKSIHCRLGKGAIRLSM